MSMDMYWGITRWVEYKANDKKHDPTHKLLSNEEYDNIVEQNDQLKKEVRKKEEEKNKALKKNTNEINKYKYELDELLQKKLQEAEEMIKEAEKEKDYQINLNTNLLQICKERSNADRKLQPKREHSGYVVLQSQEKEIKYSTKKKIKSAIVWETILQSPYTVDFIEANAREQMERDLVSGDLLESIGILYNYYECIENVMSTENEDKNILFRKLFKINFKSGYWEITIIHTKALSLVPKNMRLR